MISSTLVKAWVQKVQTSAKKKLTVKVLLERAYFLDEIGIIESVKSVSNIIAPLTGVVTEVNDALSDQPDLVNQSAQDEGNFS